MKFFFKFYIFYLKVNSLLLQILNNSQINYKYLYSLF
jgi:hypothetical protein